jgi:transposase
MEDKQMAKPLLDERLWELIKPVIPARPPRPKGGRPPVDDRKVLTGIIFVLKAGIPWQYLPKEVGWGSGQTCWRRMKQWQEAGVWEKIHRLLLNHLREKDKIDFSRAVVDSGSVRAVFGGRKRARMRRIDGSWGRNITLSPMQEASPSR